MRIFSCVYVKNRQWHWRKVSVTAAEWKLGDNSFDMYIYKLDMKNYVMKLNVMIHLKILSRKWGQPSLGRCAWFAMAAPDHEIVSNNFFNGCVYFVFIEVGGFPHQFCESNSSVKEHKACEMEVKANWLDCGFL